MKREIPSVIIAILIHAGIIFALLQLNSKSKLEIRMDKVRIKIVDKTELKKFNEPFKNLGAPKKAHLEKIILNNDTLKHQSVQNADQNLTNIPEVIRNNEKNELTEKMSAQNEPISTQVQSEPTSTQAQSEPTSTQVQSENADTQAISSCEKLKIPAKFTGQNLFPRSYASTWSKENKTVTFIPQQGASPYLDKALQRLYAKCVENSGISMDEKPRVVQFIE